MQTVMIEGYVAAEPRCRTSQAGRRLANFRVLESDRFNKADGSKGERTTGFNCVSFNEDVVRNYIEPYMAKGSRVIVKGRFENNNWTADNGDAHYDLQLVVDEVKIINKREAANDSGHDPVTGEVHESAPPAEPKRRRAARGQRQAAGGGGATGYYAPSTLDEEIPF